jgi:predicted RNA-binding Zn-ribbon protein involved in translation (DUF1610 family)
MSQDQDKDQDISKEFQKRRKTTWCQEKPWVLLMLIGWLGIFIVFNAKGLPPNVVAGLFFLSFLILVVTIIRINFIMMRKYRCPACGKIPIVHGMRGGVLVDPEECPNCGASLK